VTGGRVDDQSMTGMLRWQARHRPDAVAVSCGDQRRTYADLDTRSERIAAGLLARGLAPGERVAVLMGNCPEYLEIYQAAARSGLALVPVNPALTGPEIEYILADSGAALLIADAGASAGSGSGSGSGVATELPVVTVGGPDDEFEKLIGSAELPGPGQDAGRAPGPDPGPETVFFQGYTSGTTGRPKGCVQTLGAFVSHYRRSFHLYRHDDRDVMLMPGPLFHEAPALFSLAQLFYGGTVLLLPRFDAEAAVAAIEQQRATTIGFAVPTMLDRMIPVATGRDIGSLRSIVVAGAPLHADTMDGVLRVFPSAALHEFYGGTEIGIITDIEHRAQREHGSSVGRPVPGFDVLLLDDDDRPVPIGGIGQIYVTPVMMTGYHGRPEATAAATRTVDGVPWLTLGDLGRLDEHGHLHLVDRKSHMIISGGENVYPAEVEAVLIEHPGVADVAVIGLPDSTWGEAVTAVIIPVAGPGTGPPGLEELRAFARTRLAGYKTPRQLVVVQEIPRTASGKILKHQLKKELSADTGRGLRRGDPTSPGLRSGTAAVGVQGSSPRLIGDAVDVVDAVDGADGAEDVAQMLGGAHLEGEAGHGHAVAGGGDRG
jgi:acyl-CoA synthetase (AMP-forming)/AMP-acid ligase II